MGYAMDWLVLVVLILLLSAHCWAVGYAHGRWVGKKLGRYEERKKHTTST